MLTPAAVWSDLFAPLILALVGAAGAVFFPWLQTYWRGRKFEGIIRRELEELGPVPLVAQPNTPWWEHLRKRFVHEQILARNELSANRDFLLSLSPDIVYSVSQLWTAFETRDATQWLNYLQVLAHDDRLSTDKLVAAHSAWKALIGNPAECKTGLRARDTATGVPDALVQARLVAYTSLLELTRYGPEDQPLALSIGERKERAAKLMNWFYAGGGLLLLSNALVAFRTVHAHFEDLEASDRARWDALSALRQNSRSTLALVWPRCATSEWPQSRLTPSSLQCCCLRARPAVLCRNFPDFSDQESRSLARAPSGSWGLCSS